MKPIQAYPSMRDAVRALGSDGFVSAVLRSQRPASIDCRPQRATACEAPEHELTALCAREGASSTVR